MSSRGRGYSSRGGYGGRGGGNYSSYRGGSSYRGIGDGGGGRGAGSSGRGSYGDRGGRGGYSYASANNDRYNSGSGDRYSSGRNDRSIDINFKRPYRSDGPSGYNSRDHMSRGVSPDRKRIRMEESTGGRRSHDGANHYGGRHESYSNERRGYIDQRRSPSRDNNYRKNISDMTSSRSPPVLRTRGISRGARSSVPLRRSFRGRSMRSSRGVFRGTSRLRSYTTKTLLRSNAFYAQLRKQPPKGRSTLKSKHGSATSTEEEELWDTQEEKKTIKEEPAEAPAKSPTKHEGEGDGEATDKDAVDAPSGDEQEEPLPRSKVTGRSFIRLTCPHCREKYLTFRLYAKHLQSSRHRRVMDDVAAQLKMMLLNMRTKQRKAQRELEDGNKVELSDTALFCPLCKLNHRTSKQEHCRSESHRSIKNLLNPYCKVCQLTFHSPMLLEHHICTLEHIKNKARADMKASKTVKAKKSGSGDEGMDVDLDNFMTLDSVGDVDEVDEDSSGEKKNEESEKPKTEINVGSEHIKKIEVFYCDLCRTYLPRGADESVMRAHCRMRLHLSRYVRFRDDRSLRRQAERIHRIHQQSKEIKQEKDNSTNTNTNTGNESGKNVKPKENGDSVRIGEEEGEPDDKLWTDDVDKELGDLLRDVNQTDNKYSDDEEDSNVGRYDRFRKSDKNAEIDNGVTDVENLDVSVNSKLNESEGNIGISVETAVKQ